MSVSFVLPFRYYLFGICFCALTHVLLICYSHFLENSLYFLITFFCNIAFIEVFTAFSGIKFLSKSSNLPIPKTDAIPHSPRDTC